MGRNVRRFWVKEPRHSETISDKNCYLYRSIYMPWGKVSLSPAQTKPCITPPRRDSSVQTEYTGGRMNIHAIPVSENTGEIPFLVVDNMEKF